MYKLSRVILLMVCCASLGAIGALWYVETAINNAQMYVVVKDLDKAEIVVYNNSSGDLMYREEATLSFSLPPKRYRTGTYSCSGGEFK